MTNTVANVIAGKPLATGGISRAPLGTPLPTTATAALNGAFEALGYIGEDGVTETPERSTDKKKAWGGDIVKIVQTEFSTQYTFTVIESLNSVALKVAYGDDNVTGSSGTYRVGINGDELPHQAFVIDVKDGTARDRIVVADGQVIEVGAVTYSDEDIVAREITVEAFPSAEIGGDNAAHYIDDGTTPAVASGSSLSPTSTAAAGGGLVVLKGANFTGATALKVDSSAVTGSNWQLLSDSRIAFLAPAKSAGSYDVKVTTPAGTDTVVGSLTYA